MSWLKPFHEARRSGSNSQQRPAAGLFHGLFILPIDCNIKMISTIYESAWQTRPGTDCPWRHTAVVWIDLRYHYMYMYYLPTTIVVVSDTVYLYNCQCSNSLTWRERATVNTRHTEYLPGSGHVLQYPLEHCSGCSMRFIMVGVEDIT